MGHGSCSNLGEGQQRTGFGGKISYLLAGGKNCPDAQHTIFRGVSHLQGFKDASLSNSDPISDMRNVLPACSCIYCSEACFLLGESSKWPPPICSPTNSEPSLGNFINHQCQDRTTKTSTPFYSQNLMLIPVPFPGLYF